MEVAGVEGVGVRCACSVLYAAAMMVVPSIAALVFSLSASVAFWLPVDHVKSAVLAV
jgi:hypothetical protein